MPFRRIAGRDLPGVTVDTESDTTALRHLVVSQRLRQRRRALGLTQKQVVRRLAHLGVYTNNKALSSLEHGSGLDVAKLPELARALDCSITYLLGLCDDPARWEPDPQPAAQPRPHSSRTTPQAATAARSAGAGAAARTRPASLHRPRSWILGPLEEADS